MLKLNIDDKELKIKFGYKPTLKERVISKIMKVSKIDSDGETDLEKVEDMLMYLPEIVLVGLQVYHEEYRYDYDTKEGKQEQLDKVFGLLDKYADDGGNLIELFTKLNEEMQKDSFLSSLFRRGEEIEKAEENSNSELKEKN